MKNHNAEQLSRWYLKFTKGVDTRFQSLVVVEEKKAKNKYVTDGVSSFLLKILHSSLENYYSPGMVVVTG